MPIPEPPQTASRRADRPQEPAPGRASEGQFGVNGNLEALLSEADSLAAEIDHALAARTPREVFLDDLAERVLPLSRKDAPRGQVARRLAGYERRAVRLLREAHALQEQWDRSHTYLRQLREQWRELAAHQEALVDWLDDLAAEQVRLADWTRHVLTYQQRRLEDLEADDLPGASDDDLR